jgi:hypothetical protein
VSGTYYLVAASSGSSCGKVWVAVGTREAFSWRDITSLPATVRSVRVFHELPVGRGATLMKVLFLLGAGAVIGLAAFGR